MDKEVSDRVKEFLTKNPILNISDIQKNEIVSSMSHDTLWEIANIHSTDQSLPKEFLQMLLYVRNLNRNAFNCIEGENACIEKSWNSKEHNPTGKLVGGGIMTTIRSEILEKSAVNISYVSGPSYPALEGEYAGKPFCAAGVSLISHPKNPYAPIMHLNVRCIKVFDNSQVTTWIGGGADLTPMIPFPEDTKLFHQAMKDACDRNPVHANYEKYKMWADEYFYIPHRKEVRGVGGIFFDFVKVPENENFSFLLDIGQYACRAYLEILSRRVEMEYEEALEEKHQYWRGRYAEFNLICDRGTRFGLMSGGNYEAIFCSLPPCVRW